MTTEDTEIPVPDDSGSSGEQKSASGEYLPAKPQKGLPVVDALEGLGPSAMRRLGEFGSVFVTAYPRQLADEIQDLKEEIRQLRESSESGRDELESERIKNAVLAERIESDSRNRHLRNLGITVGTGLASTGILMSRAKIDGYSVGLIFVGVLLLLASWFASSKRKDS